MVEAEIGSHVVSVSFVRAGGDDGLGEGLREGFCKALPSRCRGHDEGVISRLKGEEDGA